MFAFQMRVQGLAGLPGFRHSDKTGLQNISGIGIGNAALFLLARLDHLLHGIARLFEHFGRQPDGSNDQQHGFCLLLPG